MLWPAQGSLRRAHRTASLPSLLAVAALLTPSTASAWGESFGPVPGNPADRLAALPIDPYRQDEAQRCLARPRPGTVALEAWLERTARGSSWGIMRCSRLGPRSFSLHAEGRALDWHLDARRLADRRSARRIIELLLATDRAGNPHALARRMGIQEIIWDCRSWWSGGRGLAAYSQCHDARGRPRRVDTTTAHRDHIHFGLSWPGARKRTSFWRR